MRLHRFLMVLTLGMVIAMAGVIWFYPSDEDFRADNPYWNGISDASFSYALSPVKSLATLPRSPQGSTLILVPYLDFTSTELAELRSFVTGGGTLVLADDYGYGNRVLEHLGTKARFSRQALLDPLVYYQSRRLPRIFQLEPGPLTDNVTSLVFNHATALTDVDYGDALAHSSPFSYIDLNGNAKWDKGEPTGPLPVISQHSLGNGRLILVADPSVFINSMATMEGNNRFLRNIAATTSSLLIDESHLPANDLRQGKDLLSKARGAMATPAGTFGLVMLTLVLVLQPIWRKEVRKETVSNLSPLPPSLTKGRGRIM